MLEKIENVEEIMLFSCFFTRRCVYKKYFKSKNPALRLNRSLHSNVKICLDFYFLFSYCVKSLNYNIDKFLFPEPSVLSLD